MPVRANIWDEIFKSKKFCTDLDPRPFVKENIADIPTPGPILDVGCGCGRHLVYLASMGYSVFGIDTSAIALEKAREHLETFGLNAVLENTTMWNIPFDGVFFAAALATNVLNHAMPEEITRTVSVIHKKLMPDSIFLVTLLTTDDYRRCGQQVYTDTFICDKGPEKGVLHTFFHENSVKELFKNCFTIDNIERVSGSAKLGTGQEVPQEFFHIKAVRK